MELKTLKNLLSTELIGLLGLGVENKQFLDWLTTVVGIDKRQIILFDKFPKSIETIPFYTEYQAYTGDTYLQGLHHPNLKHLFKAPGVWSLLPELEEFRTLHGQDSIHSPMSLFISAFRDHCIGVTGTKGKSTTSSLIEFILNQPEYQSLYKRHHGVLSTAHYCGNTSGISPYTFWTSQNWQPDTGEYFVIELSSFQLQDLAYDQLSPHISAITAYFIDHQDQHSSPEEYWQSKNTIFQFQTTNDSVIYNEQITERAGLPLRQTQSQRICVNIDYIRPIIPLLNSPLRGQHNQFNQTIAVASAATLLDMSAQELLTAAPTLLQGFQGLAHRQQLIRKHTTNIPLTISGKTIQKPLALAFFDDGYASEPDAVRAAIDTLSSTENDFLWLFIAGKDKGGDITPIVEGIIEAQRLNRLYQVDYFGAIGQKVLSNLYSVMGSSITPDSESILRTLPTLLTSFNAIATGFHTWLQAKLDEAEKIGMYDFTKRIQETETLSLNIVLSPGGSSFDEFPNQTVRSEWFANHIQQLS